MRLGTVELEIRGFVRVVSGVQAPGCAMAPERREALADPRDRLCVGALRAGVPALGPPARPPPPIPLRARAEASATPCAACARGLKNEFRKAAVTSSAHPLL